MADPQAQPIEGLSIVIEDDTGKVTTDPITGTVATQQPDGGVVVQLDAHRPKKDREDDDFYGNLADEIGASRLGLIANELYDQIAADDRSRGNHLEIRARGLGLLGLELKEPRATVGDTSAAVEGQSTVTNPLLLEACLKGWANAQSELLPSDGPVKVANKDDASVQAEDNLADAFERDLNHYFTKTATEYYPDTSHMILWGVYFGGSGFKKIYRCPMKRRPVSESVDEKDLIVSDTTKDLRSCARITHQIQMRPSVMKRMELLGAYRKTPNQQGTPQVNAVDAKIAGIQGTDPTPQQARPEDQPYTIWESQCELDLAEYAPGKFKGEGIPLPYLVTMDKESREIKAIRRDWKEDDEDCPRKRMYVKYPYVPGPGFYGTGLLNILGNASSALTAAWRIMLDASFFATFPSFLVAKLGGRQNTSDFRVGPGTGVPIETNNQPINNIIAPMPYKDVGPGMLSLIDKVQAQTQALSAAGDIPTAEGVANVPVGTMLAQIEQATKVESAAHKGMHQAQAEEIELIVELFRENPEDFWKSNKVCPKGYWDEQKFEQALANCNLEPASDPNTPSHIHRVAKGVALSQLIAVPAFTPIMDARGTLNTILGVIRQDPTNIVLPPQAPAAPMPDPNMIAANAKMLSAQAAQTKATTAAQSAQQDATLGAAKLQAEQNIASVDLAKELVIHKDDAAHDQRVAAQQHGLATAQHGLASAQAVHDANMDVAQHALDVHQVLNPPLPKESGTE